MSRSNVPPPNPDRKRRAEGEARRDEAHALLRQYRPVLVRLIQREFLQYLLDHGRATSDSVRDLVPIPEGVDPRVVGAAVKGLDAEQLIQAVDRTKSSRPEAHARHINVWQVADAGEAKEWLATHPELTAEDPECPSHPGE